MAHYHTERNHQGLENRLPQPASVTALPCPITPFNADSALPEYLATTIGQRPDECPFNFLFGAALFRIPITPSGESRFRRTEVPDRNGGLMACRQRSVQLSVRGANT
jgi:hypothetical protein